jgi:hypothetical protein
VSIASEVFPFARGMVMPLLLGRGEQKIGRLLLLSDDAGVTVA